MGAPRSGTSAPLVSSEVGFGPGGQGPPATGPADQRGQRREGGGPTQVAFTSSPVDNRFQALDPLVRWRDIPPWARAERAPSARGITAAAGRSYDEMSPCAISQFHARSGRVCAPRVMIASVSCGPRVLTGGAPRTQVLGGHTPGIRAAGTQRPLPLRPSRGGEL
ncbi:hypothetical protein NDU88_005281 [Pleurodeles waltl]|uniref:Uncharacterized protein n=1 Tax=Pleurodeles waltl TaxID=8319 RepID=A0AAV7TTT8_PLEWA|nr:hypothetical protein NDU88_005281 [Pleurodeles waltl]